jgi:DNA repair protein RecO (recombination protein O)
MNWREDGILLAMRKHGEASAIIELFTESRGLYAGIVRGGASRKMAPILQPGAQLDAQWHARLEDHLGSFTVEPMRSRMDVAFSDRRALAGLSAVTSVLSFVLPEREPHPALYRRTLALLELLDEPEIWPLAYLHWEVALLEDLGFGLDLRSCVVTGERENLIYISPKSGRAVSKRGAGEWADRLLPLPLVLLQKGQAPDFEIIQGLDVTGFFMDVHLARYLGNRPIPSARGRLIDVLRRAIET